MLDKLGFRVRVTLAALFAAMLGAVGFVQPAQAAFGGICNGNAFCLYQWVGYGAQVEGNRWQSSYYNIVVNHGGCLNLGSATWANGTPVKNNSGSIMWKTVDSGWEQYAITVFNWDNCNTSGEWEVIGYAGGALSQYGLDNLTQYDYSDSGSSMTLYHTINSIGIRCVIC
jgi:hypothetical protein